MTDLHVVHTADLDAATLGAVRRLLDGAFGSAFSDADFEHALGGLHVLAHEDGELIGHGAVVQRQLVHAGRALRTGYVEGLAVAGAQRRRGHAARIMGEVERIVRGAYELGALSTSEQGRALYAGRGWQTWRGPTAVLGPDGRVPTPRDDGGVLVLPVSATLDLDGELACDLREGEVW